VTSGGAAEGAQAESNRDQLALRADCGACFGLCCVALHFTRSAAFAVDKPAGEPCTNLDADFRCAIHTRLPEKGYSGCAAFDCLGAGQKVSQVTFAGRDWRRDPQNAAAMFAVFPIMRQLHELLWYLTEALELAAALDLPGARGRGRLLRPALRDALEATERLTHGSAAELLSVDVRQVRAGISTLLLEVSELVRADAPGPRPRPNRRGADLTGAKLARADLRAANLRGARLIAADLRGADLRCADVIGADFRDADLRGADLTGCLFLTQAQLDSAKGDAATRLPAGFARPAAW